MRQFMLFEGSEAGFLLEKIKSRAFSLFSKKVEKSMPKGISKVIVDAKRHRRTPRPWAISGKTIYIRMMGLIQIDSMRNTGRKLATLAIKIKQQVGPSRRGRKQFSHNRLRNRRSYSQLNKNTDLLTRTFRPSRHVPSLTTSFPGASARWKLSVRTASGDEQGE